MTMKLKPLGPNRTEVVLGENIVFFSYEQPVAAYVMGRYYRTKRKWSTTTSKHINDWLDGAQAEVKPQEWFDNLAAVAHIAQDGGGK
jgi:hypothetical protein